MRLFFIALLIFVLCTFNMAVGAAEQALKPNVKVASMNLALAKAPKARKPITKDPSSLQMPVHPIRGTAEHTGRLIVMYGDSTVMRAPRIAGSDIHSNVLGLDTSETSLLLAKYGCTIRQAIDVDPVRLEDLRSRANSRSGKSNPDLAAMMLIEGISPSQLLSAAREFLSLKDVAWVEIEKKTELASPQACQTLHQFAAVLFLVMAALIVGLANRRQHYLANSRIPRKSTPKLEIEWETVVMKQPVEL